MLAVVASVDAAEPLLSGEARGDARRVLSTHPAIEDQLRARGLPAVDLSRFLDEATFRSNHPASDRLVEAIVRDLDAAHAEALSASLELDVPIAWFSALYRTSGQYDLFGIMNGVAALGRALDEIQPRAVAVYGRSSFSIIDPAGDLPELVSAAASAVGSSTICEYVEPRQGPVPRSRSLRSLAVEARHAALQLKNAVHAVTGRPVSILFESLYDLGFLRHSGAIGPSLVWAAASDPWFMRHHSVDGARLDAFVKTLQSLDLTADAAPSASPEGAATALLKARIQRDLRRNARRYGSSLLRLRQLLRQRLVTRGVWGNDPIIGSKALLVEYLLKSGIEVVGCQHGAVYGTQVCNEQVHSAYSRCTRFLSYGLTVSDVAATSTQGAGGAEIIPVGSHRISRAARPARRLGRRQTVDLFYPATNNVGILCSSQRMKVDQFVALQKDLLRHLDRLLLDRVIVKLPPPTADAPSALIASLAACRRVATTRDRIVDFMRTHEVRAVLIDANYSTCLIEVLPFDCEVFVMHDPMIPYSEAALALLSRRVHYLDSVEAFQAASIAFAAGTLPARRDGGFVERYVVPGAVDVARRVVDAITGGASRAYSNPAEARRRYPDVPRVR